MKVFNTSLALDCPGKRSEAMKLARDALQIFEEIESPNVKQVRI